MLDEFYECEAAIKQDPKFLEAIKKRGITDVDLVMVDPWTAGNFGLEEEKGRRLTYARCWVRSSPTDNGYARPIEGVIPVVDLNKMEVLTGIPQIKPTFLEIAPSGIPSNIIPHSKGVKCGLIRSNSPFSYSNHRPAKPKIPKPLVYAQVSPLGTSFATP